MITDEMIRVAAVAAAKWWGSKLRDAHCVGDNGDPSFSGFIGKILVQRHRKSVVITEDMAVGFERALSDAVFAMLATDDGNCYRDVPDSWSDERIPDVCMGCDYGPDQILFDAMVAGGVPEQFAHSMAALPMKTHMFVSARRVIVGAGYGVGFVEIFGPIWGESHAERCDHNKRLSDASEAMYRMWLDEIIAKHGENWNYTMIDDEDRARRPSSDDWKGPVR